LVLLLALNGAAQAVDRTWNAAGNGSWETAGNWSPADVPNIQGERAVFSNNASARTVTWTTDFSNPGGIDGILVNSTQTGNLALSGTTHFRFNDGNPITSIQIDAGAGMFSLSTTGAIGLEQLANATANHHFVNNSSNAASLTAGGGMFRSGGGVGAVGVNVSGSGDWLFDTAMGSSIAVTRKSGAGTLTLTGANAYGTTEVNGGTVQIGNGGTTGTLGTGAVSIVSGASLVFDRSNTYSVANGISGAGNVTQDGGGTLTFSTNKTYTGTTTVNAGTLVADGTNSASGAIGTSTSIIVNNGGTISSGANSNGMFGSGHSGSKTLTINSGGLVTMTTGITQHLSNLVLDGGTLSATTANATFGNWILNYGLSTPGNGNTSTMSGGNLALTQVGGTVFNIGAGDTLNVSSVLEDTTFFTETALVKSGAGTMALSGANTYTSATNVNAGTLEVKKLADGALSSSIGAASLAAANLVLNGGTLKYTGTGPTDGTTDRLFTLGTGVSAGTLDASGGSGSPMVFTNNSSMATTGTGTRTLTLAGTNTDANTLAPNIGDGFGGATSLTKTGTGTWTLSGNNIYTGNTTVNLGTLSVTGSLANNGSDKVFVAADGNGDFATGTDTKISRARPAAAPYAGIGSSITSSLLTEADLLSGTNTSGSTKTLGMEWRDLASTVGEGNANEGYLISDVLNLTGIGSTKFVLQMNYPDFADDAARAAAGQLFLGWLDEANNAWLNAIEGNIGSNVGSFQGDGAWSGQFALGDWGADSTNNVVWAVLDHNSQFAVMSVPEPSTYALGLTGLAGLALVAWRRRKSSH